MEFKTILPAKLLHLKQKLLFSPPGDGFIFRAKISLNQKIVIISGKFSFYQRIANKLTKIEMVIDEIPGVF